MNMTQYYITKYVNGGIFNILNSNTFVVLNCHKIKVKQFDSDQTNCRYILVSFNIVVQKCDLNLLIMLLKLFF